MRKYKATVIVIIMVMLIPFMQSCLDDYDDDIYDMQAGMPFNAALATVVTPSEIPGEAMIESDNDGVAYVVNPDKLTRFETNNPGQRIFYFCGSRIYLISFLNARSTPVSPSNSGSLTKTTSLRLVGTFLPT